MSAVTDMLASMIIDGNLDYCETIAKKPDLKEGIDLSLKAKDGEKFIRTDCPVKK